MKIHAHIEFDSIEEAREFFGETEVRQAVFTSSTPEKTDEPAPVASTPEKTDEVRDEAPALSDGVDSEGMPFDPEIHSGTLNQDGTWRAIRGKSQEAKDARRAFKAGGGDVAVPEDTGGDAPEAAMPTGGGMPTGDVQERIEASPITFDEVVAKMISLQEQGAITNEQIAELHQKHVNGDIAVYHTNESTRAALYADLKTFEPVTA